MGEIWRCPECETLNQGSKCVICGYEPLNRSGEDKHNSDTEQRQIKKSFDQESLKSVDNRLKGIQRHNDYQEIDLKPGSLIKKSVIAAAVIGVLGVVLCICIFMPENINSEKNIMSETEQETTKWVTDGAESVVVTEASDTEKTETTAEITSYVTSEEKSSINVQKLNDEIVSAINEQRACGNIPHLKYDSKAEEIAADILKDIVDGTYVKSTYMSYAYGKFDHMTLYYEKKFEFGSGLSEAEAAEALLKYESDNFSSNWLKEKYQYIGSDAFDYGDGTWGIVFTLCYNDEMNTTVAYKQIKIPDYSGLTADEYIYELKKLGLTAQILNTESDNVPEGYVISIDGGKVGEYYDEIHIITIYKAVKAEKKDEYITIKGERYSTGLTELDLHIVPYWELGNRDIEPLSKMVNLTSLNWRCSEITDLTPLKELTNLKKLCLKGVIEVFDDSDVLDVLGSINDISALSGLSALEILELDGNRISDISPLKSLDHLVRLDLSYNTIRNISPLKSLTALKYLNLEGNPVSNADIEDLKDALPDCEIKY